MASIRLAVRPSALAVLLLAALTPSTADAVRRPDSGPGVAGLSPELGAPPFLLQATRDAEWNAERQATDPALAAFRAEGGGTWWARYDRRTGRPALISGSGIPWLPGAGNDLTWSDVLPSANPTAKASPEDDRALLGVVERRARELMAGNPGLFAIPPDVTLVRDDAASGVLSGGRIAYLTLSVERGGVPVHRGAVVFRLNSGNLVQLGSAFVADELALAPTRPIVDADDALFRAQYRLGEVLAWHDHLPVVEGVTQALALAEIRDAGTLILVPEADDPRDYRGPVGDGLDFRLTWRVSFVIEGALETWVAWVDALTGDVVALHDDNKYQCAAPSVPQGRVTGGVWLGPIEDVQETVRGLPHVLVTNGGDVTTDFNGVYPHAPLTLAETGLDGSFFNMNCTGCSNPAQARARSTTGNLPLGLGGADEVGNGFSTRAERNCFYHLGHVRQLASRHLTDASTNGFLSRNTPANVNINNSCNAFWNGVSVNFYRSSANCNNTGEIADIMQHEWGHGLDQFTGNAGDGARGEGLSDVVAFLATHDARLSPYFFRGNANGLRNADEATSGRGRLTFSNVANRCPGGGGPQGAEVHCEGELFSQTFWHLAQNLIAKSRAAGGGDEAGWYVTQALFFESLPISDTYVPNQGGSTYDAVVLVDDDDGNLANGTPNGAEIDDAFTHHEIASNPQVGDSADCTPPPAPAVTLTTLRDPTWQVEISWSAVPGAVQYDVVRNDNGGTWGDIPMATVFPPATQFIDDDVMDGATYSYRVVVFDGANCPSIQDNRQQVTVTPLPTFGLVSYSVDDSQANFNLVMDPGETVSLPITLRNEGTFNATNVVGTLSSTHPGVSFVEDTALLGNVARGQPVAISDFVIVLDAALVQCDDPIHFELRLDTDQGCTAIGIDLVAGCEAPDPRPRLIRTGTIIGDGAAWSGWGNDNGAADPGEVVRIPLDLSNQGNRDAVTVRGTATIASAPAGVVVTDPSATWSDVAVAGTERSDASAPPHVAVYVPPTAACGDTIVLDVEITYEGPSGSYTLSFQVVLEIGFLLETTLFFDDFEGGGNGWQSGGNGQDDWHHGVPGGASQWDPATAYSGTQVRGNDIGGNIGGQNWNGDYRADVDNWLESDRVDCRNATGVLLQFQRWLTVEDGQFDRASVLVDGTEIWRNAIGGGTDHHVDTAWVLEEYDVSAIADGRRVRLRFELETDGGLQFGGWNIDDVHFLTRERICTPVAPPPNELDCGNGVDDDGDGDTDCADADCAASCPEVDCADGVDNDGDGDADCADADCAMSCPEADCSDGVDNDGDGDTDCADADCALSCPEADCADGIDNDGDGDTDCADADCAMSCPEADCSDGIDNDGDGDTDCADPDCATSCSEIDCSDGVDNDGDGDTDCADADCALSCPEADCSDGIDNDGDGDTDCADVDCAGSPTCEQGNCADGLDNDGDGQTDCADPDCAGSIACEPRLAVNRQALATTAGVVPPLANLNTPSCAQPQFTLCTDGPMDAIVDGPIDSIRLAGEAVRSGVGQLWLYQHSESVQTMKVAKEGADLVFRSN